MNTRRWEQVGGFFESGDKCQRLILRRDNTRAETWAMLKADDGMGNGVKFRDIDRLIAGLTALKAEAVKRGWN